MKFTWISFFYSNLLRVEWFSCLWRHDQAVWVQLAYPSARATPEGMLFWTLDGGKGKHRIWIKMPLQGRWIWLFYILEEWGPCKYSYLRCHTKADGMEFCFNFGFPYRTQNHYALVCFTSTLLSFLYFMKVIVGLQFCLYVEMSDNSEVLPAVYFISQLSPANWKIVTKISVWACDSQNRGNNFLSILDVLFAIVQYIPTKYTYVSTRAYYALNPSCSAHEPFTRIPAQKLFIHGI